MAVAVIFFSGTEGVGTVEDSIDELTGVAKFLTTFPEFAV